MNVRRKLLLLSEHKTAPSDTADEPSEFVQNDYVIQTLSANNYFFGGMN